MNESIQQTKRAAFPLNINFPERFQLAASNIIVNSKSKHSIKIPFQFPICWQHFNTDRVTQVMKKATTIKCYKTDYRLK